MDIQINRIELTGTIGSVRLAETENGRRRAEFSLLVQYLVRGKDGEAEVEKTWLNILAWAGNHISEYDIDGLEKGESVNVVGRIRTGIFTAPDGTQRQTYDIIANRISFLSAEDFCDN